ncbi:MAG TPA: glycosyltransferase [Opitutaceae bacterium]|nr:glycosyltransferase [Opitutaceae bacterium]
MATIRILIAGHLCNAPRPQKEAAALAAAGHRVTVQGVWSNEVFAQRDRMILRNAPFDFVPVADIRQGHPGALRHRFACRVASELFRRTRLFTPATLGYAVRAQLAEARGAQADLTIVHSEGGLWVGTRLLDDGLRVGVDFEDWFSEDLQPADRAARPVARIRKLERELLRRASYRVTTSIALANALAKDTDTLAPAIVYNAFPWAERNPSDAASDRRDTSVVSIHWFSQTIGPGRGLEEFFAAMPKILFPCEVHLRGQLATAVAKDLLETIPADWRERVHYHPTVDNEELPGRIAGHDIGLALETDTIPSRDLTVTNKLLQYLLGGLAIVASSTQGQREIAARTGRAIHLLPPGNSEAIAAVINSLLADRALLDASKRDALESAQREFCWEKQSTAVVAEAARALSTLKVEAP